MIKKRIMVFGANGMLGQRVVKMFSAIDSYLVMGSSIEEKCVIDCDYFQSDITKKEEIEKTVNSFYPDVIINAAAFTNVDASEIEQKLSWDINVGAVTNFAELSGLLDAHLVHISSDYVFDGVKGYYSENDTPNPLGYYARTKLAAEESVRSSNINSTIIRTNVLYGPIINGRLDYVRWVVESLRNEKVIRIVTDQINNPTYIDDLVQAIYKVVEYKKYGLYNIGGKEFLSRFDFTLRIADFFELDKNLIVPILTSDLNQPAKRPLKAGLLTLKAETELGFKATEIEETFRLMKKELSL